METRILQGRHSASALKTLEIEIEATEALSDALLAPELSQSKEDAIQAIVASPGRGIVTGTLASEGLRIMIQIAVSVQFVVESGKLAGIVHMHDISRAGIV